MEHRRRNCHYDYKCGGKLKISFPQQAAGVRRKAKIVISAAHRRKCGGNLKTSFPQQEKRAAEITLTS